jgi:hypothetical protein
MNLEMDINNFKNDIKKPNLPDFGIACGRILKIYSHINQDHNVSEDIKSIIRKDLYEEFINAYPNEMRFYK